MKPCDHVRQYLRAGERLPCADYRCKETSLGDGLVAVKGEYTRFVGFKMTKMEFDRVNCGSYWEWHLRHARTK